MNFIKEVGVVERKLTHQRRILGILDVIDPHAPKWLHLRNDCSIGPLQTLPCYALPFFHLDQEWQLGVTLAVSRHVRAEVRVHEHVDAWKHRCQQHVDGHTWAAGSEPTDVAHGIVSTRRMGRGPREGILLLCPVWVSWF